MGSGIEDTLGDHDVVQIGEKKLSVGAIKSLKDVLNRMMSEKKYQKNPFVQELCEKGVIRVYCRSWYQLFPHPLVRRFYIAYDKLGSGSIVESFENKEYKISDNSSSGAK